MKTIICAYRATILILLIGVLAQPAAAQQVGVDWLTGPALERQLGLPVGLRWQGVALREALHNLARTQRVAIFLDRRVDPGRPLDLALQDEPLQAALEKIADDQNLGAARLGPVVYFGPPEAARQLRTLAAIVQEQVDELPAGGRRTWLQPQPWHWPEFAEPRALLVKLAAQHGLKIDNPQLVPHDLWPETNLPPLSLVQRLTLLLVGFDLTFEIAGDGQSIVLTPIGGEAQLVRTYVVGSEAATTAQRLEPFLPGATIRVLGDKIVVRGRSEDHQRVAAALRGEPIRRTTRERTPQPGVKVFTLNVENRPLGPLVKQLAQQLGLELQIDEPAITAAGVDLDHLISFQVERAPLEALLRAMLAPQGLDFELEGRQLKIFAAP